MPRCKNCPILEEHPEIVDEHIVFLKGCPAETYGYDCPFYDLAVDEEAFIGDPMEDEVPI